MAEYLLTYLDPSASERDYGPSQVRFLHSGLVAFEGPFVRVTDDMKGVTKYFAASRVLQVDVKLNKAEEAALLRDEKDARKSVVYYHKADFDPQNQRVYKVRCIEVGDRPFGFECYLAEIGKHFTKLIIPSWKELVYVPTEKIIGMDVTNG